MPIIQSEVRDGIALLRFDRPPVNAIELESAAALEATLTRLEADGDVRAIVLTGQGPFFSAGLDLKVVPTYSGAQQGAMIAGINRMVGRLYGLALPVVAAVNGHAIAGGLVVALACDYRIGSRGEYRLGLTETRVAIPYPAAPMAVVQAELAPSVARRWVLLARNAGPEDALGDGVLDELEPEDALLPRALAMARELAQLPRAAYGRIKRQLRGPTLARIDAAITGEDPLVRGWISAETAPAAADVLGRTRPA
jgi:enoyl-CoA hydratase